MKATSQNETQILHSKDNVLERETTKILEALLSERNIREYFLPFLNKLKNIGLLSPFNVLGDSPMIEKIKLNGVLKNFDSLYISDWKVKNSILVRIDDEVHEVYVLEKIIEGEPFYTVAGVGNGDMELVEQDEKEALGIELSSYTPINGRVFNTNDFVVVKGAQPPSTKNINLREEKIKREYAFDDKVTVLSQRRNEKKDDTFENFKKEVLLWGENLGKDSNEAKEFFTKLGIPETLLSKFSDKKYLLAFLEVIERSNHQIIGMYTKEGKVNFEVFVKAKRMLKDTGKEVNEIIDFLLAKQIVLPGNIFE
jgi:hypothetical protein